MKGFTGGLIGVHYLSVRLVEAARVRVVYGRRPGGEQLKVKQGHV